MDYMERNAVYLVYTLLEQSDCVSDCHALYATLECAKAAMTRRLRKQWKTSAKVKCCTTWNGCMSSARRTAMGLR